MDQQQLELDVKTKRKENIEELVVLTLKKMLEENIIMSQAVHVYNRTLQIVDRTIKKLNFENETILKARQAFLDVLIDGMKKHPFTLKDELREAKTKLREACHPVDEEGKRIDIDKVEKNKVIERLKHLERLKSGKPQDASEERDIECEPVAQFIAKTILSKEWLLKDKEYTKKIVEFDSELLVTVNAMSYVNMLFEEVGQALELHYSNASEKLWGVSKRKVRMGQIDNKLKE